MGRVAATEFKAKCLRLMDRVAERRETYVITKRGRPVAKLIPADPPKKRSIFGCMADQMEIAGDLDKPLRTEEEWKELERERSDQWKAWSLEWWNHGTISGKKTVGRPPQMAKKRARPAAERRRPKK